MEGLPNIEGYLNQVFQGKIYNVTGAFTNECTYNSSYELSGSANHWTNITFDASRSNSIYGNAEHVTPINCTMRIWKRVN